MFEWLRDGVLKKKYDTDRVNLLISRIKLDDAEENWAYIQIVDKLSPSDRSLLRKAFAIDPSEDTFSKELVKNIIEFKRKAKSHG